MEKIKYQIQILLTAFLLFAFQQPIQAQKDSTNNISHYLDDGGLTDVNQVLKVNVISIVNGDLPLYYERAFGKSFGIEIGAGILLPYYTSPRLSGIFSQKFEINNQNLGYSIWFQPKYYVRRDALDSYYIGLQFKRKDFNQNIKTQVITGYTLNYGFQFILGKRIIIDLSAGLGISSLKTKQRQNNAIKITALTIPLDLKIGFHF